ncbi:dihydroflavonol-4-reductase [Diplogelasinospora grovesii]|uniref:Dihydroflavonol-4-reductase n=1 Tax=Diplogelasinospora grovesii TaxID=303347 RepID=A0AAN6NBK8_9PEZI|nr:dihydroflavonol-4-reductase [Diplogelasinospora grovesii]
MSSTPLRVLVTGANGYIAQHILSTFLSAGHSVRGVVRSQSKVTQISTTFSPFVSSGQLDFALVPDISVPNAFDSALLSAPPFDVVLHTASPFNYRANSSPAEFLDPAIKGTTSILQSIARVAPSVRRVVVTSSMAAVIDFIGSPRFTNPPKTYTESDWNPITLESALAPDASLNVIYQTSKTFAEKSAWQFMEQKRPGFDLVVLNPPMVYGPLFDPAVVRDPKTDLGESVHGIYQNTLAPGLAEDSPLAPTGLHLYVDVRDLAQAHLLAATVPEAAGKRFVVCAGELTAQKIANIMRDTTPAALRGRIPRGEPEKENMPEGAFTASSGRAKEVLGLEFRDAKETIGDLAAQLAQIVQKE